MNGNPIVVSQSREEEIDRSFWKLLLLLLFTAGLSIGTVYYFNKFLLTGFYDRFFWSAILGGFFLVFVVLDTLFVKDGKRLQAIMILSVLAPLGLYYDKIYPLPSRVLLIGAAVFAVFLGLAARLGFKLLGMSLTVRFAMIAKVVLPRAITGLFIFLSVFLYLQYFEWGKFDEKVGKNFVFQSLRASEPIMKIFYPNFSFDLPVGKFLSIVVETQLKSARPDLITRVTSDLPLSFSKLPYATRIKLIEQATNELKKSFVSFFGPFGEQTTIKDYIFEFVKQRINNFSLQVKSLFGIIIAASVFLVLKGVTVLLQWLIVFAGFLIYKFLIVINFAHIGLETRSREFVVLS